MNSSLEAVVPNEDGLAERQLYAEAKRIHSLVTPLDGHIDVPDDAEPEQVKQGSWGQFDLRAARQGVLQGAVFAVFAAQRENTPAQRALAREEEARKYARILELSRVMPGAAGLARSPQEARSLWEQGLFVTMLGMVNGFAMEKPLEDIEVWHARGLPVFGFVHWGNNALADSSRPSAALGDKVAPHGGLSPLGKSLLRKVNQLGMVVNVSQLSRSGVLQAVALSSAPVVAWHSGVRAIVEHPRNLSDEEMEAIARKG